MFNQILAICFDFGDTLIDQTTEVKDASLVTLQAELIPGVAELLQELKRRGYRMALVSNGPVGSITNVLGQYELLDLFEAQAISQALEVNKPDARIFQYALDQLGIPASEYGRTVMVGNDLAADVAGANGVGMISVWLTWSLRELPAQPSPEGELLPRYTIAEPLALLPLIEELEKQSWPGEILPEAALADY